MEALSSSGCVPLRLMTMEMAGKTGSANVYCFTLSAAMVCDLFIFPASIQLSLQQMIPNTDFMPSTIRFGEVK